MQFDRLRLNLPINGRTRAEFERPGHDAIGVYTMETVLAWYERVRYRDLDVGIADNGLANANHNVNV